MPINETRTE